MYNRYIPQSDGSYRRRVVREQTDARPPFCQMPEPEPCDSVQEEACGSSPPVFRPQKGGSRQSFPHSKPKPVPLQSLLPRSLDTTDLLVIILLLLMSADCQEDQNTALLTMALYLFM